MMAVEGASKILVSRKVAVKFKIGILILLSSSSQPRSYSEAITRRCSYKFRKIHGKSPVSESDLQLY